MRDNGSSGQGRNQKQTRVPSDWQASSSWFDERQERITKGSYSRQEQRPSQQSTKKAENVKQPGKKKTASKREKSRKDKERKSFNRYYNKNKNSGKSKDELRREFAVHAKKRRRRKVAEALIFTLFIAVGIFVALSLTVLFKIETVSVKGETRYSQEQVIEAAQVSLGDNLWLTTSGKLTEKASVALPYVKQIKVSRNIPSGIILEVIETVPEYSVKNKDKYVYIDSSGKVLEIQAEKKGKTVLLSGIEFEEFVPGMPAKAASAENYGIAMEIISGSKGDNIRLTDIDVADINQITAIHNSKIRLEFGSSADLKAKVKMANEIIGKLNEEKNTREGVINLKSVTKAFFREEDLNPTTTQPQTEPVTDENGNTVTEGTTSDTTVPESTQATQASTGTSTD